MAYMEHRCGTRYPVVASVVLKPQQMPPVNGLIRETSISGMFVAVDPGLFSENSVIDVEAELPGSVGLCMYSWQAMVVRRTDDGVGLMFDRLRPRAISRLLEIAEMRSGNSLAEAAAIARPPRETAMAIQQGEQQARI